MVRTGHTDSHELRLDSILPADGSDSQQTAPLCTPKSDGAICTAGLGRQPAACGQGGVVPKVLDMSDLYSNPSCTPHGSVTCMNHIGSLSISFLI